MAQGCHYVLDPFIAVAIQYTVYFLHCSLYVWSNWLSGHHLQRYLNA